MKKTLLTVLFVAGLASVSYADDWGIALRLGGHGVPAGSFYYYESPPVHRARVYAPPYSAAPHSQRPHWYKKHVYYRPQAHCRKCHW